MNKETFTKNEINKDVSAVLNYRVSTQVTRMIRNILMLFCFEYIPIVLAIAYFPEKAIIRVIIFAVLVLFVPVPFGIINIRKEKINFDNFRSGNYTIVKDVLRGSDNNFHENKSKYFTGNESEHILYFENYGKYAIPSTSYTWSRDFSMNSTAVYNQSVSGNIFYLVVMKHEDGKRNILYAYDTDLFEWGGDEFDITENPYLYSTNQYNNSNNYEQ